MSADDYRYPKTHDGRGWREAAEAAAWVDENTTACSVRQPSQIAASLVSRTMVQSNVISTMLIGQFV